MFTSPTTEKAAQFAHRSSGYLANPLLSSPDQVRQSKREESANQQRKRRNKLTVAQRLNNITAHSHLASTSSSHSSSSSASSSEDEPLGAPHPVKSPTNAMESLTGGINDLAVDPSEVAQSTGSKKKRSKGRRKGKRRDPALSNVLTYAYLYPLPALKNHPDFASDGLPSTSELTTDWLALAPIPKGKRCLCVSGPHGAPTSLHTRISARVLLRWTSPLPAETILDCVLDDEWKFNGLIHVIDCLKWRGIDIASNEATFRIIFLQSRLSELPAPSQLVQPPFKHPQRLIPVSVYGPAIDIRTWLDLGKSLLDHSLLSPLPSHHTHTVLGEQPSISSISNSFGGEAKQSRSEGILLVRSGTPYIFGDETESTESRLDSNSDVGPVSGLGSGEISGAGDIDIEPSLNPVDLNESRGEIGWVGRDSVLDFIRVLEARLTHKHSGQL